MQTDWHLSYGSTDFAFGTPDSKFVFPSDAAPEIGTAEANTGDLTRAAGDGVLFGADTRGGTDISLGITVNGDTEAESLTLLQALATAWRADSIRSQPNAVATLRAHTGRSVFGRPRRFQQNLELLPFGITAVTADFATVDDMWYDDQQTAVVKLVPDLGGGLTAPLVAPLSTTATSDRSQTFTVGGTLPIWPVITLTGPIVNPVIEVVGKFKMAFNLSIPYDQRLVIDTRPWVRTIRLNGASVAGKIDPRTSRLSEAAIAPGRYNLSLRGTSPTGTPQATIAWRNAYPTM